MNSFLRYVIAVAAGSCTAAIPAFAASGQQPTNPPQQKIVVMQDSPAFLSHNSQGYLGIVPSDVDNDRASALKLKETTGAEVVTVDHDGPACKAGIRVHDVILQMNGQPVAGEEQLRRMLRETPAGRTISLLISRDGQQQTVSVQLADRDTLEQNAWTQHMVVPAPDDDGTLVLSGPSGHMGNGFFGALSLGSPSVGVDLDVLGSQLADYFGIKDHQGLLVKHVADNSPASRAGLKAGDVITAANGQKMATLGEWMKMLHANRGKRVQLTLVRNRKEQTVTMEAGKVHGELIEPGNLMLQNKFYVSPEIAQLHDQVENLQDLQNQDGAEILQIPSKDWDAMQQELQNDQQMQQLRKELDNLNDIYIVDGMD